MSTRMFFDTNHQTEFDGLRATWRPEHHRILIVGIDNTSDDSAAISIPPVGHLDLVQAREQWPHLTHLWDAVSHDFWSVLRRLQ
ncbi:hypothetical protein [Nocardia sp. NPDC051570]|uniref:hypothetical protein n=1 Tax=Nocardia sp. NPDC051570 TaxID=3364324 RepID=UPI0037A4EA2C